MTTCPTCNGLKTVPLKASYISDWFSRKKKDGTPTHGPLKSPACMPREAVRLVLEIRHIVCQKSPGGYFWRIEFTK